MQIVLELQEEGTLVTSDDPPVPFSCLNADFVKQVCSKYKKVILFPDQPLKFKPRLYDQYLGKLTIVRTYIYSPF